MKLSKEAINTIINNLSVDNTEIDTNQLVEAINNQVAKNTKSNLWKLLTEFKVEIPIVQRDYAQGRDDVKSNAILKQFLSDLKYSIISLKKLELDFIYGEITKQTFKPLDGQQRLTTLFLLYWFVAFKSNNKESGKVILSKFTYETRVSSREFVEKLANFELNGSGTKISEQIKDSPNFFLQWQQDPTIKGMLNTLDKIEEILKDIDYKNAWEIITSKDCPISFNLLPLNDIGLTDDLYIKMNARGKALTPFENFKAKFEGHIDKNNWESVEKKQSIENGFAFKLDQKYTDLFWSKKDATNTFDNTYLKFIAETAILNYAENSTDKEFAPTRIKEINDDFTQVSPEIDFNESSSFEFLEKYLDTYVKHPSLTLENLNGWDNLWKTNENELLKTFITKPSYNQRVLFYAQNSYLIKVGTISENKEQFLNWMRVVRNIVQNSTIDSATTLIGAINLINELSNGCSNIYTHLSYDNFELKSGFAKEQVEEEKVKAKNFNEFSYQIKEIEDSNFFKGSVSFLFDNNGKFIIEYYEKVKLYFDNKGVIEVYKKDSGLIIQFLKAAENYNLLLKSFCLDFRTENWKEISSKKRFKKSFQFFLLEKCKEQPFENDWQNQNLSELINSGIIDYLISKSIEYIYITNDYGMFFLKKYNGRNNIERFVLNHIRNKFLSSDNITCKNLINNDLVKQKLYFGQEILFIYKEQEYTWLPNEGGGLISNKLKGSINIIKFLDNSYNDDDKINLIKKEIEI
jgi:hypothetical protein